MTGWDRVKVGAKTSSVVTGWDRVKGGGTSGDWVGQSEGVGQVYLQRGDEVRK